MFFEYLGFLGSMLSTLPAFAADPSCRVFLTPENSPRSASVSSGPLDVYPIFARYDPSSTSTVSLFHSSVSDPALRASLNDQISQNRYLRNASSTGLQFHQWASDFTGQRLTTYEPSMEALHPWQHLDQEYQAFLRTLRAPRERPMRDLEADQKARYDTGAHFGVGPDFSQELFNQSPEVLYYFRKRKNYYLNQEVPTASYGPNQREDRFRYWLENKVENLERERAENLKSLVFETAEAFNRPLYFNYSTRNKGVSFFQLARDFRFLKDLPVSVSSGSSDGFVLDLKPVRLGEREDHSWYRALIDSRQWYSTYSRASAFPGVSGEGRTQDAALVFQLDPSRIDSESREFLERLGMESNQSGQARIEIARLIEFLKNHFHKTTYPNDLTVTTQMQARLEYELQLADKIENLKPQVGRVRMAEFGNWSSTQSAQERDVHFHHPETPRVLDRLRYLSTPTVRDAVTGMQWFGYSIHPDYWRKRDLVTTTSAPPGPLWAALRDGWDKARTATQMAVITAAIATPIWFGVEQLHKGLSDRQWSHPSSITIGESDQPRDSDGNRQEDTLFTVSSERVKRATYPYVYFNREALPLNFVHGTKADLENPADLVDVTNRVYIDSEYFYAPVDTITRQRIRIRTEVSQIPVEGFLFLPLPEGYDLLSVRMRLESLDSIRIFKNQKTGVYLIKVVRSLFADLYFDAEYVRMGATPPSPELEGLLGNLDRRRLAEVVRKVQEAELTLLARDLEALLQKSVPITGKDVAEVIRTGQRYSLKPGEGPEWIYRFSSNSYSHFRRYLREDGRLYFKCDIANSLLQLILKDVYQNRPDVMIKPLHSFVYKANAASVPTARETGTIGSIGHARTQIQLEGHPEKVVLDATPTIREDGTEEIPEMMAEVEAEAGDPYEPSVLETSRIGPRGQKKGGSREGALPEPVRPRRDPRPELESRRLRKLHEEMLALLEGESEQLLNLPSFRAGIRNNPQEYLPAQEVYILSRRVADYAKGHMGLVELNEILTKLFHLKPENLPKSAEDLREVIFRISESEWRLWEKCAAYYQQTRKADFAWSQDLFLKKQVEKILQILQGHDWVPVAKSP